jgi:TonB family protein
MFSLPRPAPYPVGAPPTPTPEPVKPAPPAAQPEPPAPPPMPAVPNLRASAPIAAKAPVLPSVKENMTLKAADNRLRDALRGIDRPPEAPRLGEYQRARIPPPPVASPKPQEKQLSLSDLARQLEEVQRPQPKAAVASKPKPAARPVTAIKVTGDESGLSRYLALVQGKISEQWLAPAVDVAGRSYQVVIKFRLHKSGRVSDVTVEQESGNGYYDDAGKRAVLSVGQLPPFPPYVTEEMLETHFSFTVGEEVG